MDNLTPSLLSDSDNSFLELLETTHENRGAIFTEEQHLIMRIHRALAVRAHRHFFGHRGFGRG